METYLPERRKVLVIADPGEAGRNIVRFLNERAGKTVAIHEPQTGPRYG